MKYNNRNNNSNNTKGGWTLIEGLVVTIILTMIVGFIFLVFSLVKGCSEVSDKGLKNVIEDVWEGQEQEQEQ